MSPFEIFDSLGAKLARGNGPPALSLYSNGDSVTHNTSRDLCCTPLPGLSPPLQKCVQIRQQIGVQERRDIFMI